MVRGFSRKLKKNIKSEFDQSEQLNEDIDFQEQSEIIQESNKNQDERTNSDSSSSNIPANMILKNLYWPPNQSNALLMGIQRRNEDQAIFLLDILRKFQFDAVCVGIACDEPYLIRTQKNFIEAWQTFLQGKFDYKFLVNPHPHSISEIILNEDKLSLLFEGPIFRTKEVFDVSSQFVYTSIKRARYTKEFSLDNYFTPLLHYYNNPEQNTTVYIHGFPELIYREIIVRSISLEDLQDIYDQYCEQQQKNNKNFDVTLLKPELFIQPKIQYTIDIIRQCCHAHKKVLILADMSMCEQIENSWKNIQISELKKNVVLSHHFLQAKTNVNINMNYTEYLQKHVILDFMFPPIVEKYFVQYESFPFKGEGIIGAEAVQDTVFVAWKHYRKIYKDKLYGNK